jgi:hypothetical protein
VSCQSNKSRTLFLFAIATLRFVNIDEVSSHPIMHIIDPYSDSNILEHKILLADEDQDDPYFFDYPLQALKIAHVLTIVQNGEDLMKIDLNMPGKMVLNACLK